MFERGFYSIEDGHANSLPMIALLTEGGTTFFGLYMLIYETSLSSEAFILEKNVYLLGQAKGNLAIDEIQTFIDVCIEQSLFEREQEPPTEENPEPPVYFRVVESSQYLWWYRMKKDKKSKDCSEAGKKSAESRANNQDTTTANSLQQMYKNYSVQQ